MRTAITTKPLGGLPVSTAPTRTACCPLPVPCIDNGDHIYDSTGATITHNMSGFPGTVYFEDSGTRNMMA